MLVILFFLHCALASLILLSEKEYASPEGVCSSVPGLELLHYDEVKHEQIVHSLFQKATVEAAWIGPIEGPEIPGSKFTFIQKTTANWVAKGGTTLSELTLLNVDYCPRSILRSDPRYIGELFFSDLLAHFPKRVLCVFTNLESTIPEGFIW